MRFLFVDHNHAGACQDLLAELDVVDVRVVKVKPREIAPGPDVVELLKQHPNAPAAACEVNRKYRKAASAHVQFSLEPKKFRPGDIPLRHWLRPPQTNTRANMPPRAAFLSVAASEPKCLLCLNALDEADQLLPLRWGFANRAAELLARHARGDNLGPMRDWKANHGLEFAANGPVVFKYRRPGAPVDTSVEWHLKEGDNTSREGAARVYFDTFVSEGAQQVVVFYVGPHPNPGTRKASTPPVQP